MGSLSTCLGGDFGAAGFGGDCGGVAFDAGMWRLLEGQERQGL